MWANREHWARRLPKNLFSNRTEYRLSKSRAPARPQHDQVNFFLVDQLGHHFPNVAFADHDFVFDALELFIQASCIFLGLLLRCLSHRCKVEGRKTWKPNINTG